ncbi:MAG: CDP-alcohol phosphatidyltransferase family protein [Pseudomonadota bacterium]
MFDRRLQAVLAQPLNAIAGDCERLGLSANQVTVIGFGFGVLACLALALGQPLMALVLFALNRLADGLDGALARRVGPTDLGGYLDITLDFLIYSGLVFAHAVAHPTDALMAAFLIFSFVGTGSSFLAYGIMDAKRGATGKPKEQSKAFTYLGGLTEGFETIVVLALIMLLPSYFFWIALVFGGLCWVTTAMRIAMAVRDFR